MPGTNGRILAPVARRAKLNNQSAPIVTIGALEVVDTSQELCTLSYAFVI